MRLSSWALPGLALTLLLLASAAAADCGRLPGNQFTVTDRTMFLTGETGDVASQTGVLLLDSVLPAAQGSQNFLAPGVDVLGLITTPSTHSWFSRAPWDKDTEVVDDAVAILYFQANAQAINTIFTVRLYDVAPDGKSTLVDVDEKQFVTALSPTAVEFPLATSGTVLHKDHVLRLELAAQTANAAVLLQYGGDTPSALQDLHTRWLDSDADGLPDSDEVAVGRNPLNSNDPDSATGDADADGLSNQVEKTLGTDPHDKDTDGDGFGDGLEVHAGTNPLDKRSVPYDLNQNGLPDNFETNYFRNVTNIQQTAGPCTPGPNCVDPFADPDGDGCNNLCEAMRGLDPNDPDSDDDGVSDGDEVAAGTDPANSLSVIEGPRGIPEPVAAAAAFAIGSTLVLLPLTRRP